MRINRVLGGCGSRGPVCQHARVGDRYFPAAAPPPGDVQVQRGAHHPRCGRRVPADGAPGGAGPGEGLSNKLLGAVLITDDDRDRAQAVVPETPVELGEVQALGSHAYPTRNRCSRDYPAQPGNPWDGGRKLTRKPYLSHSPLTDCPDRTGPADLTGHRGDVDLRC